MLIDFTVENFRSIKEPVTLSAIASSRGSRSRREAKTTRRYKTDDEIAPAFPAGERGFALLPALGIFGANASGKSNVVKALGYLLRHLLPFPWEASGSSSTVVPFRLDEEYVGRPTTFELRVWLDGSIYTYNLSLDRVRIHLEQMERTPPPPARARLLFRRQWDEGSQSYTWKNGEDFSGPHLQLQSQIRHSQAYVGLLAQQLRVEVLDSFQNWTLNRWATSCQDAAVDVGLAAEMANGQPELQREMTRFIRSCDTAVDGFRILTRPDSEDEPPWQRFSFQVGHHGRDGHRMRWSLDEESTGTQRLFGLSFMIVDAIGQGSLLVVDELDSSLHPHLTRRIVRMFQNPETNPRGAQLVFTSHDTSLHDDQLLRRDQTWFTQKRDDGSTELYSLSDFPVRNDLAIERAYLDGRFGAVPVLPSEADMLSLAELGP